MSNAFERDLSFIHPAIGILGRTLFSLIFFLSGVTHFTDVADYVSLMHPSIPYREFWVYSSGAVELAGAAMLTLNFWPRLGAWLIVFFLIPVTAIVHGVGLASTDERTRQIQLSFLLKGVSMTGAALLITQLGVKRQEHRADPPVNGEGR